MMRLYSSFRRVSLLFVFWVALWGFFLELPAQGHNANETYIYLQISENAVTGRFETPLADLDRVFGLDEDGDKKITEQELGSKIDRVNAALRQSLSFVIAGEAAPIRFTTRDMRETGLGTYGMLSFDVEYSGPIPDQITARYDGMLPAALPGYRVLLLLESNAKTGLKDNEARVSLIFDAQPVEKQVSLTGFSGLETLRLFIGHGFHHILIGFDHIAFLAVLLLPSVLVAREGQWQPVESFGEGLWNILKIVTVFTIAHSLTLSLAALDVIGFPEGPVEALIALSIVAAAVINIVAVGTRWALAVMFALGLLHGLGFANVMEPLGVAKTTLLQSLLGFNLGIELGQILIVSLIFPGLFLLRRRHYYVQLVLRGGSCALILLAVYWFGFRALNLLWRIL